MNKAEILTGKRHIVKMGGKEAVLALESTILGDGYTADVDAVDEDGQTIRIILGRRIQETTIDGQAVVAHVFTRVSTLRRSSTYRTVHSKIYGEGRRYSDRPGATYYRAESGAFTREIWDAE